MGWIPLRGYWIVSLDQKGNLRIIGFAEEEREAFSKACRSGAFVVKVIGKFGQKSITKTIYENRGFYG